MSSTASEHNHTCSRGAHFPLGIEVNVVINVFNDILGIIVSASSVGQGVPFGESVARIGERVGGHGNIIAFVVFDFNVFNTSHIGVIGDGVSVGLTTCRFIGNADL